MDNRNDDIVGLWVDTSIYDQQISIENTDALHGIPRCSHEEGRCWAPDEMFIQVEFAFDVVVSRARETGFDR